MIKQIDNIEIIRGDVLDKKSIQQAIDKKTDYVFNLSGHSGPKASIDYPFLDTQVNVIGSLNILEGVRKVSGPVLVFMGSRLEYGKAERIPVDEEHPIAPLTLYGINKFTAERYHLIYKNLYGVKTVMFRGSNPYGPHIYNPNPSYNIINFFIDLAQRGKTIKIFGTGSQLKDYIYIEDFCEALILGATNKRAYAEVFNLGSGQGISLYQAAKTIVKVVGKGEVKKVPLPKELRKIEAGDYVGDIGKIRQVLSWKPKTSFEEGLKKTLAVQSDDRSTLSLLLKV